MFSDGIERVAYIPADLHKQFAEDRLAKDEGWHWTTDPTYSMKRSK